MLASSLRKQISLLYNHSQKFSIISSPAKLAKMLHLHQLCFFMRCLQSLLYLIRFFNCEYYPEEKHSKIRTTKNCTNA